MRIHRQHIASKNGRPRGAPPDVAVQPYTEIQRELGKALRMHYEPPPDLPHNLLTLMMQLNDDSTSSADGYPEIPSTTKVGPRKDG